VAGWATNISAGAPDESGQTLTFSVSNDNNALFELQPAISSDGTLSYTPGADVNGSAMVTVSLQDDGGTANGGDDTSASVNFMITVTAVNDAPSFTKGADQMATEDSGAVTATGWATFISTGPADESAQTPTFNITGNTNSALFTSGPAVNASTGDLTYTVASGAFGTATITLTVSDDGGTANGGVDTSAAQTFDITVVEVPDDRSYTALAHTELAAGGFTAIATPNTTDTNGVLVGDPSLTVTSTTPFTSTNGGSVTMAADGSFSYTPPPGVTGTAADSFDYTVDTGASATVTVTINGTPTWYVNNQASAGGNGTSSAPYDTLAAAATASSAGDTIYVFEGDGTSTGYNAGITLKDNQLLLGQGEDLVINSTTLFSGNTANRSFIQNASGPAVTLASNNTVAGLKIQSSLQGIAGTGQSGTLLLDNLDLQGNTNEEIDLLNHAGTVTIQNSTIVCTVVPALLVDGGDAAITVDNVSLTHAGGPGIQIQNRTGGSLQYINGSIMQTNTEAVLATNSAGTYRFDNITQTGSGRGISISNCGTANFTFNNLSVTNNSTLASLHLSGAGLVSVAGTSSLSNAGGPAINALNTTFDTTGGGGSAVFSSVSSAGSSLGVNLQATSGTLTINGGTMGSTLKILQGDVDVTYNGTISTTSGKALDVQSMSGGDVTIGGAVTSTGGTGITVSGNTLASNEVSIAGTTTLTNTTGTALTAENNVSGTLRFAALNIDNSTSSQRGILAGNNGTFSLVNTGGSVNSGSSQAIGISNTGIMLTFQSVSAANASTGIGLNNTPGSFTVTGVGTTDGSGGTIQNITNNGIELISAENISLSNMTLINANLTDNCGTEAYDETGGENCRGAVYLRDVTGITLDNVDINDTSEMGITGTSVRGLALTDSSITNAGNSTSESGILLRDLLGTTAGGDANLIQNTTVTNSAQIGVFIRNLLRTNAPGGAFDRLLMDNVTVTQSGDNTAADNVTISLRDNASNQGSNFQVAVQNCTFTGTNGQIADAIQFDTGINATGDFSITGTTTNNCNTGINISAANSSTTTFLVNNNASINVDGGQGVNIACNGTAVMTGTVSNNTIDSFNANNPGFGIDAVVDATGTLTIDIDNNNVTDFSIPVRAGARNSGTGTANISITDNTMNSGGGFAFGVLWVFSGNGSGGESNVVCANISGNNFNDPFGTQEYYIEQYPGNTLNLQGYTGLASSQAAIQTFLEGNNVAGDALVETCCGTSANVGNATCSTP
jgi:hypothetical protein